MPKKGLSYNAYEGAEGQKGTKRAAVKSEEFNKKFKNSLKYLIRILKYAS